MMGRVAMTAGKRRLLIAAAFIITLLSAMLAPSQETAQTTAQSVAQPTARTSRSTPSSPSRTADVLQREAELPMVANFERTLEKKITVVDIFEARPVPGMAPPPLAKPEPPKLPFIYQGSVEEAGRIKIVLLEGELIHVVEKGGKIGASYRLDGINTDKLVITYLPLEAQQLLAIGDAK
jgi:hypothetical protein